jgi:ABC-2 type transport system ATP-binding protein
LLPRRTVRDHVTMDALPRRDDLRLPAPMRASRLRTSTSAVVDVRDVAHNFGRKQALGGVSLTVAAGEVHGLLGPNGAGKTTLLRVLSGLVDPRRGSALVAGIPASTHARELRQLLGLVPSGGRSFYLRISGLENLVFFARLYGFSRREALQRARERLHQVGLADVARQPVYAYSHGMQQRLGVARALLADPKVLLIDEATHDLDPEGSQRVRALVRDCADRGAAVIWTTQRLEEVRGFADRVTLLVAGEVRFAGTVPQLMALAESRAHVVELDHPAGIDVPLLRLRTAVSGLAQLEPADSGAISLHLLRDDVLLGDVLVRLANAGARIRSCRQERSEIEDAFFVVTASQEEQA